MTRKTRSPGDCPMGVKRFSEPIMRNQKPKSAMTIYPDLIPL